MRERHSMQKAPALNFKNIARILMKLQSSFDSPIPLRPLGNVAHDQLFIPSKSRKGFEQMGVPKFKAWGSKHSLQWESLLLHSVTRLLLLRLLASSSDPSSSQFGINSTLRQYNVSHRLGEADSPEPLRSSCFLPPKSRLLLLGPKLLAYKPST